jgi:hypothetical protein
MVDSAFDFGSTHKNVFRSLNLSTIPAPPPLAVW